VNRILAASATRSKYIGLRAAAAVVPRLPEGVAYGAAGPLGTLAWVLTPRRRAAVLDNLGHVLAPGTPPETLNRVTQSVYQNIVRYYVDLLRSPHADVLRLRRERLHAEGLDHLQTALTAGRGVIIATVHYGAPEVALQAARGWGLSFFVLTEPIQPPELSDLLLRVRSSHGHRFMPAGLPGVKEAVRTLRRGGAVLLVVDRDIQENGICVPFFGFPARMPSGAVELSRMTGAPIVSTVSRRLQGGGVHLVIEPALEQQRTASRSADLKTNVARLIARFEPHIRRDPAQWIVLERIWDRPDHSRHILQARADSAPRTAGLGDERG
jgi:lauroyl/myristoyl acyltransferase